MNLKGKVMSTNRTAIVTGGSGGIGSEICKRLARDGCRVVVHYGNDCQAAERVVEEIADSGGVAIARSADITDEDAIGQLFQCRTNWGREGSPSTVSALGPLSLACSPGVTKNGRSFFATFPRSSDSVIRMTSPRSFRFWPATTLPG